MEGDAGVFVGGGGRGVVGGGGGKFVGGGGGVKSGKLTDYLLQPLFVPARQGALNRKRGAKKADRVTEEDDKHTT